MKRKDYPQNPVEHIKINGALTVDELIHQFQGSGLSGLEDPPEHATLKLLR